MRYVSLLAILLLLSLTVLAQTGGVKGKVREDGTDRSLAGVEVTVAQNNKTIKTSTSSSKGEFFIQGLADGIYSLSFEKTGFQRGTIRIKIEKGKITDLSNRRLALPRDKSNLVTLLGTVFDKEGFSVQGAKVEISRLTAGNVWDKLKTIYTSQSGDFVFRAEPTDYQVKYRATVTYKDVEPQIKEKETDTAGLYKLTVTLPANISGPKKTDMTKEQ